MCHPDLPFLESQSKRNREHDCSPVPIPTFNSQQYDLTVTVNRHYIAVFVVARFAFSRFFLPGG